MELAAERNCVVVGGLPVSDTIKSVEGGFVGRTIDRELLVAVCPPVVIPAGVDLPDDLPDPEFTNPRALRAWVEVARAKVRVEILSR